MNPNTPIPSPNDDDLQSLAGEYVLGTLSAAKRREVEARMAVEPTLREAVEGWEQRLHPLTALAEPVEPSAALWARIERSVAPQAAAAADSVRRAASGVQTWWNNLKLWRGLAGTGFAAAAILAAVLVVRIQTPATPQYLVVLVAPQDKAPGWVVQTSGGSREQLNLIPLGTVAVPADKSLQFWTKADSWRGPVSLGLVQPGRALRVPIEKLPPLEPNQLFELTLEPANGSPLDRPTGPIQFIGRAVKVL
ncbi:anti-sigma factor [Variovorax sp. LT2P21]|uniref:anti-sigma factor n=1 Tax=Variovorax sp. LT2P21 TaxID=3443731 RepID=UPI003F487EFE